MREFQGKVAVVTGAASGIGKALAQRFAEEGMSVVLADFEQAALDNTAREFTRQEFDVHPVFADVSQRASVEALRDEALKRYGAVHLLANNAGVAGGARTPIWEAPQADWDWILNINLWGVINGIRAFVPSMLAHDEPGHIVNTASVAGLLPGSGIYGVSKHAVVALTETLYQHLRVAGSKLNVSVLCPPVVLTRIFESERNRLGVTSVESLATPEFLAGALEAASIADAVFSAVREERFYIVPHSRYDALFEARFADIVARRNPEPSAVQSVRQR